MRKIYSAFFTSLIAISLWGSTNHVAAQQDQAGNEKADSITDCKFPEIRDELALRVATDQKARFALIDAKQENAEKKQLVARVQEIDAENTNWLRRQVEEHGWLGKSLVGEKGAHNAWLLVQHADRHPKFQKSCLELIGKLPAGEVAPIDIAYLTDRVLSAEGLPQRYGTQCTMENGVARVKEVEDPDNLNQRREELGLPPIEEYLKMVEEMYSKQAKDN